MTWLAWLGLVAALAALFVVWDWVFCGGKYCRWFGGSPP
jgi:hypothetical protein